MERLVLRIESCLIAAGDDPPTRYIHEYDGTIHLPDENYESGELIGEFRAIVLDLESAVNERYPVFEVFDYHSETYPFYEALYEHDGSFKDQVSDVLFGKFSGRYEPNILLLQRLLIKREHRGQDYGLEALQALVEKLRVGVGVIAMKPFPLQFEGGRQLARKHEQYEAYGLDQFKGRLTETRTRLRRYYARLGFKLMPKTQILAMAGDDTAKVRNWQSRSSG